MKASLLDLRRRPGRILEAVENRETVTLSRRGKPVARITPLADKDTGNIQSHETFGMWKDRDEPNVHDQVRGMRKGRFHDL